MTFQVEVVCLNFVFVGDEVCLHSMDCCFDLGASCYTHVSFSVTIWLKKFSPSPLHCVRKSNVMPWCSNLWSSVSIFSTQCAHNFQNLSLSDNFLKKWPWNLRKMQGKWCNGESSIFSNLLFNCTHQIFIHHKVGHSTDHAYFHVFIKQSHPSPYHWTTHGIFSIRVTKLTNFTVSCSSHSSNVLKTAFHMRWDSLFS